MAQLRHDYDKFQALNAEVVLIVPNGPRMIAKHIATHAPPYPILSDPGARVAAEFGIDTKQAAFLSLFTRAVFVVDRDGVIRYADYGASFFDEPDDAEALAVLAGLAAGAG